MTINPKIEADKETHFTVGLEAMEERIVLAATSVPRHFTK